MTALFRELRTVNGQSSRGFTIYGYGGLVTLNIGINHGFQCSNIRWITRKVFEHKAAGRVFKHLPSDPANV